MLRARDSMRSPDRNWSLIRIPNKYDLVGQMAEPRDIIEFAPPRAADQRANCGSEDPAAYLFVLIPETRFTRIDSKACSYGKGEYFSGSGVVGLVPLRVSRC